MTAVRPSLSGPMPLPRPSGRDPGPPAPHFLRSFAATDADTREVLGALMQVLAQAGVGDEDRANAELVLAEALNNVAEHAYADGPGPVELSVDILASGLACEIADRGRPMPSGMVPSPGLPRIDPPADLPEGGFGWHIIRCLTTDLRYRREQGHNRLSLRVPWSDFG